MRRRAWIAFVAVLAASRPGTLWSQSPEVATTTAMLATTALDLTSTFACHECREAGPVALLACGWQRSACLVGLNVAEVGAVTLLGHELRQHAATRRWWWLPAAALTTGYLISWRHNRGVS